MTCFYLNKAFGMHEFVRVNIPLLYRDFIQNYFQIPIINPH